MNLWYWFELICVGILIVGIGLSFFNMFLHWFGPIILIVLIIIFGKIGMMAVKR